jgi:cyanate permease
LVLMATIFGMAFGGWVSGYIFDLTGSYDLAFFNGIIWNIFNILLIVYLMFKGSNRKNNIVIKS